MTAWYYAEGQNQVGPFSDDEFEKLVADGKILGSTLVWNESMTDWRPYNELSSTTTLSGAAQVACTMCNRIVAPDEAIEYQGRYVCVDCKPEFVQRLKEGAPLPGMVYAGFWIRVVATILDGLIIGVFMCGIFGALAVLMIPIAEGGFDQSGFSQGAQVVLQLVYTLASYGLQCAYQTFFLGRYGATPGKMLLGLKVVRPDGSSITYLRGFARYWGTVVSGLTCWIGFIIAAFDDEKRTLHDHICSTRVIYA